MAVDTAYAVLRVHKLRSDQKIETAAAHNRRANAVPNADPARRSVGMFSHSSPILEVVEDVIRRRVTHPEARVRTNSVRAMEVVLSASPEYFRPGAPEQAGVWEDARLRAWRAEAEDWLLREMPGELVDVRLHLDEATPHLQAILVPVTGDGRLSANELFTRRTLRGMQSSYAAALAGLGIERGIQGSRARHKPVKKFYGAVEAARRAVEGPEALDAPTLAARAAALPVALSEARQKGAQARSLEAQRDRARKQARELAAQLRDVDLEVVLERSGLDRDPGDRKQWRGPGRRISVEGRKWFDHEAGQGGGGAIDLAKHLQGADYQGAVAWLAREFGAGEAAGAVRAGAETAVAQAVAERPEPEPEVAEHDEAAWPAVAGYLEEVRGFAAAEVQQLREQDLVRADRRRNAVFPMVRLAAGGQRQVVGAELVGTDPRRPFKGLARESRRNRGYFRLRVGAEGAPVKRFVLVESAIKAIALATMVRDRLRELGERWVIASTAGARPDAPWIKAWTERGWRVVAAYDADAVGDRMSAALIERYPGAKRLRPEGGAKDWGRKAQRCNFAR
jgi:hypothetical protein